MSVDAPAGSGGDERLLIECVMSAWRPRDLDGRIEGHPAWYDLSEEGRAEAHAATVVLRRLESAMDVMGFSSTAHAVLARIAGSGLS